MLSLVTRAMILINFAYFMLVTAQIIPLDKPVALFGQQVLRKQGNQGKALLQVYCICAGEV